MAQQTKNTAQKKKFPNALVIVFCIMILSVVLTWLVPAGQYNTLPDSSTLDPSSYHRVDQSPVGLWGLLDAVFQGMSNASSIIVFTFLVGGYFNVLIESKSVDGFLSFLMRKLGSRSMLIIPVLVLIMSLLGATGVMANPVVAVIPIGILLAKKLKMDQIVGVVGHVPRSLWRLRNQPDLCNDRPGRTKDCRYTAAVRFWIPVHHLAGFLHPDATVHYALCTQNPKRPV